VLHFFFISSRRRHTRFSRDWSSDVCSSDLATELGRDLSDEEMGVVSSVAGGNPLAVLESVRLGAATQHLGVAACPKRKSAGQEYLERVIEMRLERLPRTARNMLDALAVCGKAADLDIIQDTLGLSPGDVATTLEELQATGLVRVDGNRVLITHEQI